MSDFEDVFSIFGKDKSKRITKINTHKNEKSGNEKSSIVHDSYETGFPPFPPLFFDGVPMANSIKSMEDSREHIFELEEPKETSKLNKQKKPKEKVIMSFTEFFIPFMNHKSSFDFPSFPRKFDFFENIFRDLGFREPEEAVLKTGSVQKTLKTKTTNKSDDSIIDNSSDKKHSKKSSEFLNLSSLFRRPRENEFIMFHNGADNEKEELAACCANPECKGSKLLILGFLKLAWKEFRTPP